MKVNRITNRNALYVYTVFFQRSFFLSGYFCRNGKKNVSLFLRQKEESFIFLFPGGYSCNTRFFISGKIVFISFGKPDLLCNRLFFDYITKVHIILYYAIAVHIFLYLFNCYLHLHLKCKVYSQFWLLRIPTAHTRHTESHTTPTAAHQAHGIRHTTPTTHTRHTESATPRQQQHTRHTESGTPRQQQHTRHTESATPHQQQHTRHTESHPPPGIFARIRNTPSGHVWA